MSNRRAGKGNYGDDAAHATLTLRKRQGYGGGAPAKTFTHP
jgi:hypothetical protein